jgi:hypothetical protein
MQERVSDEVVIFMYKKKRSPMTITKFKAFGAALVLSAAFAAPALARDAGTLGPQSYPRAHHQGNFQRNYQGNFLHAYNRSFHAAPRSRPGSFDSTLYLNRPLPSGWDPDPTPSGGGN